MQLPINPFWEIAVFLCSKKKKKLSLKIVFTPRLPAHFTQCWDTNKNCEKWMQMTQIKRFWNRTRSYHNNPNESQKKKFSFSHWIRSILYATENNVDWYERHEYLLHLATLCVCVCLWSSVTQSCWPVPVPSVTALCWPPQWSPGEPSQQIWHLIFSAAMAVPSYLSARCPRLSRSHLLTLLLFSPCPPLYL